MRREGVFLASVRGGVSCPCYVDWAHMVFYFCVCASCVRVLVGMLLSRMAYMWQTARVLGIIPLNV